MILSFRMTFKNELSDNQSMLKSLHRVPTLTLSPQYHLCFKFAVVYSSQRDGKQSLGHFGWFTYIKLSQANQPCMFFLHGNVSILHCFQTYSSFCCMGCIYLLAAE